MLLLLDEYQDNKRKAMANRCLAQKLIKTHVDNIAH